MLYELINNVACSVFNLLSKYPSRKVFIADVYLTISMIIFGIYLMLLWFLSKHYNVPAKCNTYYNDYIIL